MDAAMTVAMLQPCRALGSFVSYGGSALVTYMFAIGLVESVALRQKELER